MKRKTILSILFVSSVFAANYSKVIESPDAKKILEKDKLAPAKEYKMPVGCVTTDADAIARGKFIFHNLNGKKAKKNPPKGLSRKYPNGKTKQYGNCVACHNIEGAKGAGNIGPDLTSYHANFIKSGIRDAKYMYQQIADPRVYNADTTMTINLTTKLFNEKEICEIVSYIVAPK